MPTNSSSGNSSPCCSGRNSSGPDTTFTAATRLDVAPFWLVEGLREMLNEDPLRNREEIVKRAALAERAPTLAQVTGWKELSDDRLLGLWQRAFCYYLVECLTHTRGAVDRFSGLARLHHRPRIRRRPAYLFPTEMGWQRELREAPKRDRPIVYSWDDSAAELAADPKPSPCPRGSTPPTHSCARSRPWPPSPARQGSRSGHQSKENLSS